MWAIFLRYGACPNAPEALTMWAKYAIYEAIDKIPEICSMCPYASKENLTLRPSYESVQIHIYLFVDNTITNLIVSIVNILHNAPLCSIE